jgi:hypothetical protein
MLHREFDAAHFPNILDVYDVFGTPQSGAELDYQVRTAAQRPRLLAMRSQQFNRFVDCVR